MLDLIPLRLGPLDVALFHLEDLREQVGRGIVLDLARERDAGVVGADRVALGDLVYGQALG